MKKFSPKGVGIDIVQLSRASDFFDHHKGSLNKILNPMEHKILNQSRHPGNLLAYFFSAKEAVFKSLDLDWLGIEGFRMIGISLPDNENEFGRARLQGEMKQKVDRGLREWYLQFLTVKDFLVAVAIAV